MAAHLGLLQKHFARFRITNGTQCISCGRCSTACPRGVLNHENAPYDNRFQGSQHTRANSLRILI